jgi:membrane protease YdiL (CAAX protease family)
LLIDPAAVESRLRQLQVAPGLAGELPLFGYFAVVNPIAEELFWRATIYGRFRADGRSPRTGAIISGSLFGVWHILPISLLLGLPLAVPIVLGIVALGVFLALFYERVRITRPLIVIHALCADVPVLLVAWIDVLAKR